jgi:hypothetical protein
MSAYASRTISSSASRRRSFARRGAPTSRSRSARSGECPLASPGILLGDSPVSPAKFLSSQQI